MSNNHRILVSGNTTMDIVTVCREPYNPSGKRAIAEYKHLPGGQAANVANLLAYLGNEVSFLGAFGNDAAAQDVTEDFRVAGVEIAHSAFCKVPHHLGFVRVDESDGERFIDMYRHTDLTCSKVELDPDWIASFDCVYLDNHEPELAKRLASVARTRGVLIVADLEEIRSDTKDLLAEVDVLIAPGKILESLASVDDTEIAAKAVLSQGFSVVIATLGEKGCIGIARGMNSVIRVPGIKVAVNDTTGAGDAFHAAFVHAMLNGHSLGSCMIIANEIAGEKCIYLGPRIPGTRAREIEIGISGGSYESENWQRHHKPTFGS